MLQYQIHLLCAQILLELDQGMTVRLVAWHGTSVLSCIRKMNINILLVLIGKMNRFFECVVNIQLYHCLYAATSKISFICLIVPLENYFQKH